MTLVLDPIGNAPDPSSQAAPSTGFSRCLLVAEHGAEWTALADAWREGNRQVSVLLQHSAESEPAFVRRLCVVGARAQVDDQPFECAVLVVAPRCGPYAEAARTRLLQLLAECLLRAGRPVMLRVECPVAPSVALCHGLERIRRVVVREYRASLLLVLQLGTLQRARPDGAAPCAAG